MKRFDDKGHRISLSDLKPESQEDVKQIRKEYVEHMMDSYIRNHSFPVMPPAKDKHRWKKHAVEMFPDFEGRS